MLALHQYVHDKHRFALLVLTAKRPNIEDMPFSHVSGSSSSGGAWQFSSSILPPTFRFSHALALIVSYWGADLVWVIVLYCGYKLRKLLENLPLLALVTITLVIVGVKLAT